MTDRQDRQPALRDAARIAAAIAADEAEADEARERLQAGAFDVPAHDEAAPDWLSPDERLVATRPSALVRPTDGGPDGHVVAGELVVTTSRMVVRSAKREWSIALEQVLELSPIGERGLLVTLDGFAGVALDVARPRLLRVEIAAARAMAMAARAHTTATRDPGA